MEVIAHRGAWCGSTKKLAPVCPKNSQEAFEIAVKYGFGIETDFRDLCGEIVISHNPPGAEAMFAREFFKLLRPGQIVAANIKADGIALELRRLWKEFMPEAALFAFDMSIPDTFGYVGCDFPFLERQSEYEKDTVWSQAAGFWIDCFHSTWFDEPFLVRLLNKGRPVCIVSPELHGRDETQCWNMLENLAKEGLASNLWLCTDKPFTAIDRFGEFK